MVKTVFCYLVPNLSYKGVTVSTQSGPTIEAAFVTHFPIPPIYLYLPFTPGYLIHFYFIDMNACTYFYYSFSNTTQPSSLIWSGQVSRTPAKTDNPINLTFAVDSVSYY